MQQCNLLKLFNSTSFGRISPSSGALAVKLQHMVFCAVQKCRKPYAAT